jgi:outer membrane immunogenic protein
MKHLFFGSVALLALASAGPAMAADMPVRAPVYKAAPVAVAPYSWAGPYVGGHVGYGWARAGITDINCYCIADPPFDFPGFQFKFDYNGWLGGAQLGYNWQLASWVYGLEFDFSFSGMRTSFPTPLFPPGTGESFSSKINWFGTGRARLGYAFDRVLPYVTGGFAYADIENRYNDAPNFSITSGVRWGWTAGGGVELAIDRAWTIRGEYLYVRLQTEAGNFTMRPQPFDWDNHFHVARAALSYKFDWGGPVGKAPLVARY